MRSWIIKAGLSVEQVVGISAQEAQSQPSKSSKGGSQAQLLLLYKNGTATKAEGAVIGATLRFSLLQNHEDWSSHFDEQTRLIDKRYEVLAICNTPASMGQMKTSIVWYFQGE